MNAASHTVGTNFIANSTIVNVANSTQNAVLTPLSLSINAISATTNGAVVNTTFIGVGNTLVSANLSPSTLTIGSTTLNAIALSVSNFVANSLGAYHTGTMNAASFTTTGITANVTGVYPTTNTSGHELGLTAKRFDLFATTIDISGNLTANGALGGGSQVLTSNSTGGVFWAPGSAPSLGSASTTDVLFDDGGAINGTAGFIFTKSTNTVTVSNTLVVVNLTMTGNLSANGATGVSQILSSNSTGGVYWGSPGATPAAGSDTYVQFNDGGTAFGGTSGFTFTKSTNNVTIANTLTIASFTANNLLVAANAINVTNQTNTATFFATTSANVGANVQLTTTGLIIGPLVLPNPEYLYLHKTYGGL